MTDKQEVLDAIAELPENATLKQISEHLQIMAAVREGDEDFEAGRTKTHEEVKQIIESWANAWASK